MNELEKRMYFFVPYNILPIQQGIQAGHSMGEYALKYGRYNPDHLIWEFLEKWKTWMILNGGTTNDTRNFEMIPTGSLNQIADQLLANGIESSPFIEPDLNNALSAVCFICDERVFNYKDYPEFYDWFVAQRMYPNVARLIKGIAVNSESDLNYLKKATIEDQKSDFPVEFDMWTNEVMGNAKNVFLRNLIKGKKFA